MEFEATQEDKAQLIQEAARYLAVELKKYLAGGAKVLWFITGGSSIDVGVQTSALLRDTDVKNLTVMLTDERYGPLAHSDSNWQQLVQKGFALPGAVLCPILGDDDIAATTQKFDANMQDGFSKADFKIGLFGMGADGHTAGIMPHSPALSEDNYAISYDGEKFQRITMTPKAIKMLDEAVLFAYGEDKWPMLAMLKESIPVEDQPGQILKQVPVLKIFSNLI